MKKPKAEAYAVANLRSLVGLIDRYVTPYFHRMCKNLYFPHI